MQVGRVWYDPFGEIISHTLPLTLTDRLWTGMQRDATIGLYRAAAGWYDPYSTQGIHAGVSVPRAPAGLSLGRGYNKIAGSPASGSGLLDLISGVASPLLDVGGSYVRARAGNWLSALIQKQGRIALAEAQESAACRFMDWHAFRFLFDNDLNYEDKLDRLSRRFLTLEALDQFIAEGQFGADLIDLGGGVLVVAGWGVLFDLPMLLQGEWTAQEYIGRMGVRALGSGVSWGLGWLAGKILVEGFMIPLKVAAPWILVVSITVDLTWGRWIEPMIYEQYPHFYPRGERIGPAENPPW